MPTQITSAGITFNDTTSLTSANIGTAQLVNGSVTAAKLGANEQKQICKAWVNFDGTTSPGTIRSSYNVSSITKNGTGDYTVNFPVGAMADANYSGVFGCNDNGNTSTMCYRAGGTKSTTAFQVSTASGVAVLADNNMCMVAVFGN